MNKAYKKQAQMEAQELIEKGFSPECLTHFVEYPADYYLFGEEYQYLATPLPLDTDLSGHLCIYYTLGELANLD